VHNACTALTSQRWQQVGVSGEVSAAIGRAMSKDRCDRQATAGALIAEVRAAQAAHDAGQAVQPTKGNDASATVYQGAGRTAADPAALASAASDRSTMGRSDTAVLPMTVVRIPALSPTGAWRRAAGITGVVVVLVAAGVIGAYRIWGGNAPASGPADMAARTQLLHGGSPVPPAPDPTERSLGYSLIIQRSRGGKPFREPSPVSEEVVFGAGDRLRLMVSSPQEGYVYVVNEGPAPNAVTGLPDFTVLFPALSATGGSPRVAAGKRVQIPEGSWLRFLGPKGTETLWLIWSADRVRALDGVEALSNPRDRGRLTDAARIGALRAFLADHVTPAPVVCPGGEANWIEVRGEGEVLVYPLRLEHR
jgi:hypothetical protein